MKRKTLWARERALCNVLWLIALGCTADTGDSGGSGSAAMAVRTPSGLDASRPLSGLTDDEREQFCHAARTMVFSATTPDRECEVEAAVNVALLPQQDISCAEYKSYCLEGGFIEVGVPKCRDELQETAATCAATVGDGEECSLATGSLRATLLPDLTCQTDLESATQRIPDVYNANALAQTPECERYQLCRRTL